MWVGFWKWSIETTHSLSAWVMSLENVGNALPLRGTPRLCFWDRWGFLHSCDWPNQLCMVYHDGLPTWLTIRQPKSAIHRTNPFPFPIFIYCDGKWNKFVIYRKKWREELQKPLGDSKPMSQETSVGNFFLIYFIILFFLFLFMACQISSIMHKHNL